MLQKYIGLNLLATFALALVAFCLIILLGILIQQIHYYEDFSLDLFVQLLPIVMPFVLFFALPVAILVAVVMVFGRLSAKNEIAAMRAHGMTLGRVSVPAFLLGVFGTAVLAYLQWKAIPLARHTKRNLIVKEFQSIAKAGLYGRKTLPLKNVLIHYRGLAGEVLLDVDGTVMEEEGKYRGYIVRRFNAKEGRLYLDDKAARMYFILKNGTMQVYDPAHPENPSELVRFEGDATIDIDVTDVLKKRGKTLGDLTMGELENALAMMPPHQNSASAGLTETAYPRDKVATEWHKRLATSLVPLLFVLLAVPLGTMTRSTSRLVGLGLGCLPVLILYYPLNTLAETLAANGTVPAPIAMWAPALLFTVIGIFLFAKVQ